MPAITFDYAALYYLNWWLKYDRHYCVALKSSDPETQRAALVKAAAVYRVARNPRLEHDKEGHRLATALQIIGKPDQREFKGAKLRTSPPSQILTGFKSASYLIPLARRRVTLRHDPPHYLAPFLDVVFCAIAAAILLPPPGHYCAEAEDNRLIAAHRAQIQNALVRVRRRAAATGSASEDWAISTLASSTPGSMWRNRRESVSKAINCITALVIVSASRGLPPCLGAAKY